MKSKPMYYCERRLRWTPIDLVCIDDGMRNMYKEHVYIYIYVHKVWKCISNKHQRVFFCALQNVSNYVGRISIFIIYVLWLLCIHV